ncbi:unnamed protein product, partial [Effrenium voratum]
MSRLDDLAHALAGLGTRLHDQRLVARPRDVEEVAACVRAANGAKCSVSVVGGNHSGYGQTGDLVLEMSNFTEMQREGSCLRVGGGVTLEPLALFAQAQGLAAPLGTAPTVGLGLVLQGGVGHLTRSRGMSVDSVRALQLVTCTGRVVEVSGDEEPELFAGAKGCAPNFGVVVSLTLEAAPFRLCASARRVFPASGAALRTYMAWAASLPNDCSADCCLYFRDESALPGEGDLLMGVSCQSL